ncbi:cytochrome-c oxidase, cbb3-type subunit III [Rickettsiales bacterium]|nr:cytochrome-c oxidase, cbb3-type subunit III [Rickettsiales bacterium]
MSNNKNNSKDNNKEILKTTGHSWDGIEEYNTPAPRWWLIVWGVTIIWSFIYWVFFPSWPTIKGSLQGINNWSSASSLNEKEKDIRDKKLKYSIKFKASSFEEILNDQELLNFALNGGRSAFKENCAACHGTGAAGGKGFPNLNDDDWLWGGKLEDIYTTLLYGIRANHEDTKISMMPSFGRDEILNKEEINDVTQYVRSLSKIDKHNEKYNDKHNEKYNEKGKKIFTANCAVCHGDNGKGDKSVGAPNLTDSIWLYGGSEEEIKHTIYYSRYGVMPHWNERLSDATIRQLTIYVHSLGGGE